MDFLSNIRKIFFYDEMDMQSRLLNLMLLVAIGGGTISMFVTIVMGSDAVGTLLVLALDIFLVIALIVANWFHNPKASSLMIAIAANIFLLPAMYFFNGGVESGMPIWFVLGLIFSFLLLKGKTCIIMYMTNFAAVAVSLYIESVYPESVRKLSDARSIAFDNMQSILIVTCVFGAIFKYQSSVYEKQKAELLRQEQELRRTMLDLEKANKAKSDFLANMSHEIRTPINAVLGMNEMILRESGETDTLGYAANIQSAGHMLLSLINDILDFSKIESGNLEIIPGEYELFSLLHDCYNMVQMRARDKNLALHMRNAPDIPAKLYGDEVRIREILTNLMNNAVKYTENGFVDVFIDYEPQGMDHMLLKMSVKDSGMGISEENQLHLFDAFRRLDEDKNHRIEGTGLGLTVVRELLDLMEGTITFHSEVGQGTEFHVEIPQVIRSDKPLGNFAERLSQMRYGEEAAKESFQAPNAHVLVVDDVGMNLDVFRALMKRTKVKIDTALSGAKCLELIKETQYHIIYMDHMMPEMDGVETLHAMRTDTNHLNTKTPVVALTANAIIGAEEEYMAAGFDAYLTKPLRSAELEQMMLRFLPEDVLQQEAVGDKTTIVQAVAEVSEEPIAAPQREMTEEINKMDQLFFLDTEVGLEYCADDEELYMEVIESYIQSDCSEQLQAAFDNKAQLDYQTLVHAIKSTSLTIGATALSEKAKALEMAVREDRWEYVEEKHASVFEQYQALLSRLRKIFPDA